MRFFLKWWLFGQKPKSVSGKGRFFGRGQRWDWGFSPHTFSQAHSDMVGPGHHVACPLCPPTPTPCSDPSWKWTPCPHIRTLCTPHIQLPLAHSLGLGLCQWALCPAEGRTTHVKALGVGLAHLDRDCQGSRTWSMVWMGPCPRPYRLFTYWSDSCRRAAVGPLKFGDPTVWVSGM